MSKELTTRQTSLQAIETALANCSATKLRDMTLLERTLTLAESMAAMRTHFNGEILATVKSLANTPLGFLTDRGPGSKDKAGNPLKPYGDEVVRDCVIEAMLRGAQPIGNEFNIIASRCYLSKQYFERQVREWPGLTSLVVVRGVPSTSEGGALVPMRASWKLHGVPAELICEKNSGGDARIPVRVNASMGVDAIFGKATRKLYAQIFARVSGSTWIAEEAEMDAPTIDVLSLADIEAPVEPEASSEVAPEQKLEPTIFIGIEAILGAMDQVTDVNAYQEAAGALLTTDEDKILLGEWCDVRREAIRESRGQRLNGKE